MPCHTLSIACSRHEYYPSQQKIHFCYLNMPNRFLVRHNYVDIICFATRAAPHPHTPTSPTTLSYCLALFPSRQTHTPFPSTIRFSSFLPLFKICTGFLPPLTASPHFLPRALLPTSCRHDKPSCKHAEPSLVVRHRGRTTHIAKHRERTPHAPTVTTITSTVLEA